MSLTKIFLNSLKGRIGIGHVRYSTTGSSLLANAQPLMARCSKGILAVAHNGNLVNTEELRESAARITVRFFNQPLILKSLSI